MTQNNDAASQEAQFWRLKYFELLMHSTQVIGALGRPVLAGVQKMQAEAMAAAAKADAPK